MDSVIKDYIGSFGRWQFITFFGASVVSIVGSMSTFLLSFTAFLPHNYRCLIPECETVENTQYNLSFAKFAIPEWEDKYNVKERRCNRYRSYSNSCEYSNFDTSNSYACMQHVFDNSQYHNSIIMEFDIPPCLDIPDHWPLKPSISRIQFLGFAFMFGLLIGSVLMGVISDKFGRKKTIFGSLVISSLLIIGGYWSKDLESYFILRLLNGIFNVSLFTNSFIILIEMADPSERAFYGIILNIPFAGGEMLLSFFAFFIQEWRYLHIFVGILTGMAIMCWFIIPESPRWLLSLGKKNDAINILLNGAILNGKTTSYKTLDNIKWYDEITRDKLELKEISKSVTVIKISLIMFYNWFSITMVYYGLSLISVNLGGNIYINFFLSGLVEIPSYIITFLLLSRLGRRWLLVVYSFMSGVMCICAGLFEYGIIMSIFSLFGKFCVSGSFSILYLYTAELYPTELRNTVVGIASMCGRIGGICAPFIASLQDISMYLPFILMGFLAIISGLASFFLPETLGSKLPECINDIKELYSNSLRNSCVFKPKREIICNDEKHYEIERSIISKTRVPDIYVEAPTPKKTIHSRDRYLKIYKEDRLRGHLAKDSYLSRSNSPLTLIHREEIDGMTKKQISIGGFSENTFIGSKPFLFTTEKDGAVHKNIAGPTLVLPKGASRKFSQLSPAPIDSPDAKRIGCFVMIPTLKSC
uniref:Major facilitator superfamily (MFS) profile domain-containing protein n=1 Tax=Lepeophtheirus salmonis TaxID=72036 RepID=A0A0K2T5E1_LEPSM